MARSGSAPILEPEGVDLFLAGGDFSAADMKLFRALLHKSRAAIAHAQERIAGQSWFERANAHSTTPISRRKNTPRHKTKRTKP